MTITQAFKKFGDKLKENILSIANKRSKDLNYSPTESSDISTKGYVDTKITTPDIGSFGQVLTVDTTDENGKPLTWKLSGYNWHLIHSDDYQNIYAALNSSIATQDIEDWEKGISLSSPSNQEINALYGFLSQVYTLVSDQQRSSLNFPLVISNLVSNGKLLLSEGVILPNKEYCLRILNVGKKNEFDPHKSIEVFVYYIESIDYWWIAKQKMSDAEYIRFKSDGTIQIDTFGYTDATLSLSNKAADAKVVGEELVKKVSFDNTTKFIPTSDYHPATKKYVDAQIPTQEEIITLLAETGYISPVTDANGDIFTDLNKDIIIF